MKIFFYITIFVSLISNYPSYAEDSGAVKYQPMSSGVEIIFTADGSDWLEIRSIGEADLNIGDSTDKRNAATIAEMRAKADLSKFMSERIRSEETSEEIIKLCQTASSDGQNVNKESTRKMVHTTIEKISIESDAILKGVLPLETRIDNNKKLVRVIIGFNRNTIATANSANKSFDSNSSSTGTTEKREEGVVIKRSRNYNNY